MEAGGAEGHRAMASQKKQQEERRQQRAEQIEVRNQHDEDGALIEPEPEPVSEDLACPTCYLLFDSGMRCPDCDVLLQLGTVYVAPPLIGIGLILTLGGAVMAAGGPIDV